MRQSIASHYSHPFRSNEFYLGFEISFNLPQTLAIVGQKFPLVQFLVGVFRFVLIAFFKNLSAQLHNIATHVPVFGLLNALFGKLGKPVQQLSVLGFGQIEEQIINRLFERR